jgi:hypothetical protein
MFGNSNNQVNTQSQNSERIQLNNDEFNTPSALQMRLDTTTIIRQIDCFISGELLLYAPDDTGITRPYKEKIGEPLVNAKGRQCVLTYLNAVLVPAVVMGNWSSKFFRYKLAEIRRSLNVTMMLNLYDWEISETDYIFIIDTILDTLSGFLSRLIENKERESFSSANALFEKSNIRG